MPARTSAPTTAGTVNTQSTKSTAQDTKSTTQDTKSTTQDTKSTTQDTKSTTQDTKSTTQDTKSTTQDTKSTAQDTKPQGKPDSVNSVSNKYKTSLTTVEKQAVQSFESDAKPQTQSPTAPIFVDIWYNPLNQGHLKELAEVIPVFEEEKRLRLVPHFGVTKEKSGSSNCLEVSQHFFCSQKVGDQSGEAVVEEMLKHQCLQKSDQLLKFLKNPSDAPYGSQSCGKHGMAEVGFLETQVKTRQYPPNERLTFAFNGNVKRTPTDDSHNLLKEICGRLQEKPEACNQLDANVNGRDLFMFSVILILLMAVYIGWKRRMSLKRQQEAALYQEIHEQVSSYKLIRSDP